MLCKGEKPPLAVSEWTLDREVLLSHFNNVAHDLLLRSEGGDSVVRIELKQRFRRADSCQKLIDTWVRQTGREVYPDTWIEDGNHRVGWISGYSLLSDDFVTKALLKQYRFEVTPAGRHVTSGDLANMIIRLRELSRKSELTTVEQTILRLIVLSIMRFLIRMVVALAVAKVSHAVPTVDMAWVLPPARHRLSRTELSETDCRI